MEPVVIGAISRAHGVQGLVRARPTGPTLATLAAGDVVQVTEPSGRVRDLTIASLSAAGGYMLLGFAEITGRDDAESVQGARIAVDAARLPAASEPDEFYVRDLIGCTVWIAGTAVGAVREVINRPANDVLEVEDAEGAVLLLPFSRDAVRVIDPEARRIELREGLIDLPSEPPGER